MRKQNEDQGKPEAPSFKDKLSSKLKTMKLLSSLAKGTNVPLLCVCLFFGLGFFAVATRYPGSIYIQIMNALTLSIYNPGQLK